MLKREERASETIDGENTFWGVGKLSRKSLQSLILIFLVLQPVPGNTLSLSREQHGQYTL